MGCIRQKISGDGVGFVNGGGTVISKVLEPGEKLLIDHSSIVGFASSVNLGIQCVGNPCAVCLAGEGCCLTTLTGPGLVVLQSMPIEKFVASIIGTSPGEDGTAASTS